MRLGSPKPNPISIVVIYFQNLSLGTSLHTMFSTSYKEPGVIV